MSDAMDLTVQLKKSSPGDVEEIGDIINLWITDGRPLNPGVKFFYLHVRNAPDLSAAQLEQAREKLTSWDRVDAGTTDPETGEIEMELRNSRVWSVMRGAMPQARRREMLQSGETTIQWGQAKSFLRRKLAEIPRDDSVDGDAYNATQSVEITDEDLIGA